MKGAAAPDGIHFGPTATGKLYISMYTHRGMKPMKTCWHPNIPPKEEFELFTHSDVNQWLDARGHYWSHKEGGAAELGTAGERIAKHPRTTNPTDPSRGCRTRERSVRAEDDRWRWTPDWLARRSSPLPRLCRCPQSPRTQDRLGVRPELSVRLAGMADTTKIHSPLFPDHLSRPRAMASGCTGPTQDGPVGS